MLELSAETFAPHVGTTFRVLVEDANAGVSAIELAEVRLGTPQPGAPREQPFSLHFTGPADRLLEQGTYVLDHDQLGRLDIFLVAIGPGRYEAVFN